MSPLASLGLGLALGIGHRADADVHTLDDLGARGQAARRALDGRADRDLRGDGIWDPPCHVPETVPGSARVGTRSLPTILRAWTVLIDWSPLVRAREQAVRIAAGAGFGAPLGEMHALTHCWACAQQCIAVHAAQAAPRICRPHAGNGPRPARPRRRPPAVRSRRFAGTPQEQECGTGPRRLPAQFSRSVPERGEVVDAEAVARCRGWLAGT